MPSAQPKVLLIIPAYNEEDCILETYHQIKQYNIEHGTTYDVIVINDCSRDATAQILFHNKIPHINLIHNLGIGGAVQTGYRYALDHNYDIAVQYDGDGQHDVNYIEKIVQPIAEGRADFVIGSRFIDSSSSEFKSSAARQMGIKIISFFIKFVTKKKVYDTTSGFRAVNKKIISLFSNSYPVEYPEPITTTELLRMKCKMDEVPVQMHERIGGESSIKAWKNIYYMINVIITILIIGVRRYPNAN